MSELWNVYDCFRNDTGRLIQRGAAMQPDEYHLVVNLWLKNAKGEYLISRRSPEKSPPLCWEATGGSVLAGETSRQGAVREVAEELGIRLNPGDGRLLCSGYRQYDGCPDILDVWVFDCDAPIERVALQEGETVDARYASIEEIRRMVCSGEFYKSDSISIENYNYLRQLWTFYFIYGRICKGVVRCDFASSAISNCDLQIGSGLPVFCRVFCVPEMDRDPQQEGVDGLFDCSVASLSVQGIGRSATEL